jgi:antitoxin HicB
MSIRCTVNDGKLVLNLEEAEEGGYIVTSPLNPELIAQGETITEAFANARDAAKALKQSHSRLLIPPVSSPLVSHRAARCRAQGL